MYQSKINFFFWTIIDFYKFISQFKNGQIRSLKFVINSTATFFECTRNIIRMDWDSNLTLNLIKEQIQIQNLMTYHNSK